VASSIEEAHQVLRAWLDPVLAQVARTDTDNK
jgi:hypothetical protein